MRCVFPRLLLACVVFAGAVRADDFDPEAFEKQVRASLAAKDWDELERLSATARAQPFELDRITSGPQVFYRALGLNRDNNADMAYEERLAVLEEWAETRPDAPEPVIAKADVLVDYAWKARGSGWAHTVASDAWPLFRERLRAAVDTLDGASAEAADHYQYYYVNMVASLGLGDRGRMEHNFHEGVRRFPRALGLYHGKTYFLLPRWHGRQGEWVAALRESAGELPPEQGDIAFTMTANMLLSRDEAATAEFVEEDHQRMERTFTLLAERNHPDGAHWSRNYLSRLARQALWFDRVEPARQALLGGVSAYDRVAWDRFQEYEDALERTGVTGFLREIGELERADDLDEAERRLKDADIYSFPSPHLLLFYLRNGMLDKARAIHELPPAGQNPEDAPIMDAFHACKLEMMACDWPRTKAYGARFDARRGHNITGKNALFAAALATNDADAIERLRAEVLAMKTERHNYQLLQQLLAGKIQWPEMHEALVFDGYYGQAALMAALDAIARNDKALALRIASDVLANTSVAGYEMSAPFQSLRQGSLYRFFNLDKAADAGEEPG